MKKYEIDIGGYNLKCEANARKVVIDIDEFVAFGKYVDELHETTVRLDDAVAEAYNGSHAMGKKNQNLRQIIDAYREFVNAFVAASVRTAEKIDKLNEAPTNDDDEDIEDDDGDDIYDIHEMFPFD